MNRQERRRTAKTGAGQETLAKAFARREAGDLAGAERLLRDALRRQPGQADAICLLGEVLIDGGQPEAAVALLRPLAAARPRALPVQYSFGNACRMAGHNGPAADAYRAALALDPGFAGAHHGLGLALRAARREAEAAPSLRRAVAARPGWAVGWQDLGITLAVLGELGEAEAALARAVALDPALGEARRHLVSLRASPQQALAVGADIAAMQALARQPLLPEPERIATLFALGRLKDAAAAYDAAFADYAEANTRLKAQLERAVFGYDRARMEHDVALLTSTFTSETLGERNGWGDASEAPVFIVGMPRAGSSLFEQIAASHPAVFGAGECAGIGGIAARLGAIPSAAWTPERLREEAAAYLAPLREEAGQAARIVDKMPDNVFQLGLIAALFPNARIVFCERDARDTGLSCYFQRFAQPYVFDTDLADCGHRLRAIERLARHWRAVLPLKTMTLSYEAMIAEPESESRRLIAFLGLDWNPSCLDFHRTARPVRTASWSQVRQPLYDRSVGRWRHYQRHLSKLFEALEQPVSFTPF